MAPQSPHCPHIASTVINDNTVTDQVRLQGQVDNLKSELILKKPYIESNEETGQIKADKIKEGKFDFQNVKSFGCTNNSCTSDASGQDTTGKKHVHWNNKIAEPTLVLVEHQYEIYRNLLLSITFVFSAATEAVIFMLDDKEDAHILIKMAANFLTVKLNHSPSGSEIFDFIDECCYNEEFIISKFFDICQTEEGISNLKSLLGSSIEDENQENFKDQISTSVADGLSSVSDDQLPTTVFEDQITESKSEEPAPSERQSTSNQDGNSILTHEKSLNVDLAILRKEQDFLLNSLKCMVCKDRPIDVTLLPCGHFVLCSICVDSCHFCPECKKNVLAEVKTYLG